MILKGRRVVVRADLPGERIGSVVIPECARQQPLIGEVVLLGDKCGGDVRLGDRVIFPSMAWSRFNAPGYGFPNMLLWEKDLLAVLQSDQPQHPSHEAS